MHNVRFTMHRILLFITVARHHGDEMPLAGIDTSDTHFRPAFLAYNHLAAPIELARARDDTRRFADRQIPRGISADLFARNGASRVSRCNGMRRTRGRERKREREILATDISAAK